MTFCGEQRDALTAARSKGNTIRDAARPQQWMVILRPGLRVVGYARRIESKPAIVWMQRRGVCVCVRVDQSVIGIWLGSKSNELSTNSHGWRSARN